MTAPTKVSEYEIVEAVDGGYIVLRHGFQIGHGPYDASGCSSQTFPTKQAANAYIKHDQQEAA